MPDGKPDLSGTYRNLARAATEPKETLSLDEKPMATFRDIGSLSVGNLALALGRPGRTVRASLRAIGVLGPAIRTPHGGKLDRYVESDRQIPRGFAGGPLIDADGAVIGMNTRTLLRGDAP